MVRIFISGVVMLLCIRCTYLQKETCEKSTNYYKNMAFNIVIKGDTKKHDLYYVVSAKNLNNLRDTTIRIANVFAMFCSQWESGDTLTKEAGTTTVQLIKKDSLFGIKKFVGEWTCENFLINGESESVWRERMDRAGYP